MKVKNSSLNNLSFDSVVSSGIEPEWRVFQTRVVTNLTSLPLSDYYTINLSKLRQ